MKMNTSIRKTPKGVTLIELSVVIAVILVLISVLFIGASYYRTAANKAACQINQSAIAKAGTSVMNIQGGAWDAAGLEAALIAAGGPMEGALPADPGAGGGETYVIAIANGEATVTCGDADHN